jgi:hypothetical protein
MKHMTLFFLFLQTLFATRLREQGTACDELSRVGNSRGASDGPLCCLLSFHLLTCSIAAFCAAMEIGTLRTALQVIRFLLR